MEETTKSPRGRPSSRSRILDAALALVAEIGANRLTLDAVAERAGVSKGGLLYNYPTKEALLTGMVERFISQCEEHRNEIAVDLGQDSQSLLRALFISRGRPAEMDRRAAHAMLAAIAENPRLLQPVRERQGEILAILDGAEDPVRARILWLALEGLNFLEMLGIAPFTEEERDEIVDRIVATAGP